MNKVLLDLRLGWRTRIETVNANVVNGERRYKGNLGRDAEIRKLGSGVPGHAVIHAIELHTQIASVGNRRKRVVKLVSGDGQLQKRECNQRKPSGLAQSKGTEQFVVFALHEFSPLTGSPEYRQIL